MSIWVTQKEKKIVPKSAMNTEEVQVVMITYRWESRINLGGKI